MWLARDADGELCMYDVKPVKQEDLGVWGFDWEVSQGDSCEINRDMFPEVKWSDEEPRELVLKPIKEE